MQWTERSEIVLKRFFSWFAAAFVAVMLIVIVLPDISRHPRTKPHQVSRVKSDLRTMRTAIEAYAVDYNSYPPIGSIATSDGEDAMIEYMTLPLAISTPITYITKLPMEPFKAEGAEVSRKYYTYMTLAWLRSETKDQKELEAYREMMAAPSTATGREIADSFEEHFGAYLLWSHGPGGPDQVSKGVSFFTAYDPTNGTKSLGHVWASQKQMETRAVPLEDFAFSNLRGSRPTD